MCKHLLLIFLLSGSFVPVKSQNLFINSGFEEINWCTEFNVPCAPVGWFNINPADIPKVYGRAYPRELLGKNHLPVPVENMKDRERPFVYTMPLCPLRKGVSYKLTFYLNTSLRTFHHLDILFLNAEPNRAGVDMKDESRLLRIVPQHIIAEVRRGWHAVEVNFVSAGNWRFCLLGNVAEDRLPFSEKDLMNDAGNVFYFIDEIKLQPIDGLFCSGAESTGVILRAQKSRHTEHVHLFPERPPEVKKDTILLPELYFATNEWEPSKAFFEEIEKIISRATKDPYSRIDVVGHTDNTGSADHNRELSLKRAYSILHLIKLRSPENAGKIFASGKGSEQPVADNLSEEGRARNRRVEIIITRE